VGLREWFLQPYLQRLKEIEKKLSNLDEISHKLELLETKLEQLDMLKDNVKDNRLTVRELQKEIEAIRIEIEAIKIGREADFSKASDLELEEKIMELLKQGYTSPSELYRMLNISKDKLYRILNNLIEKRRIAKIKKKRRVYYIPVEEEI